MIVAESQTAMWPWPDGQERGAVSDFLRSRAARLAPSARRFGTAPGARLEATLSWPHPPEHLERITVGARWEQGRAHTSGRKGHARSVPDVRMAVKAEFLMAPLPPEAHAAAAELVAAWCAAIAVAGRVSVAETSIALSWAEDGTAYGNVRLGPA